MSSYADIIVDITTEKLDRTFQYRIPEVLEGKVQPGSQVKIPFGSGNRLVTGYVLSVSQKAQFDESRMKEIREVSEDAVTVEARLIALAAWMKHTYGSTMIQALKTVLPVKNRAKAREKRTIVLMQTKDAALDTLVLLDVQNRTVRELLRTSRNGDAVLVAYRRAGDLVEPVGVIAVKRTHVRRREVSDRILELLGRHRHGTVQDALYADLSVILDRCRTGLGALGRDDNNAVRASRTVDGGSRTVLQHVDRLHLLEVDIAHVGTDNSVDYDERALACGQRIGTAQHDLVRAVRVTSVGIRDRKTGHLALEQSGGIGEGTRIEIVALEARYRSGNLLLGGLAVTDEIVRLHGGEMIISSEIGKGTQTVIVLPKNNKARRK